MIPLHDEFNIPGNGEEYRLLSKGALLLECLALLLTLETVVRVVVHTFLIFPKSLWALCLQSLTPVHK